jgi:uncharacterized membrane protein HdeD (DUF308 family)
MRTLVLARAAATHWWALALRGLAALAFGLAAFVYPSVTLAVLVILYGAFALADGVLALVAGVRARWPGVALAGLLGVLIGLATLFWPGITALALLFVIAAWAIVTGALQVAAAVQLRRELANEWLLGIAGIGSIVFGLLLVFFPGAGALSLLWVIGAFAVAYGIMLLLLGLRLRALPDRLTTQLH